MQLIRFLQSIEDEDVIVFIFSNLKKSGIDELFDLLRLCDARTEDRWQTVYSNMFILNK